MDILPSVARVDRQSPSRRIMAAAGAILFQCFFLSLFLFGRRGQNLALSGAGTDNSSSEISISLLHSSPSTAMNKTSPPRLNRSISSPSTTIVIPPDGAAAGTAADDGSTEIVSTSSAKSAGGAGPEVFEFQRRLLVHIAAHRQYPAEARRQRLEGIVELMFTMDRNGIVLGVWVKQSSGYTILDREAIATVLRAQPLPAIPKELPDPLNISLPVAFGMPS